MNQLKKLVAWLGSLSLVVALFGTPVMTVQAADDTLVSISMQDTNSNGKIDRFVVTIDNDSLDQAHVYGTAGWAVTDNGNAVSVSGVSISGVSTADPQVFFVNLSEADPDLTVDTDNPDLELTYTPQGLGAGTEISVGVTELFSITANDTGAQNELDAAPPVPTSGTFYDGDSDGDLDLITVVWSENISAVVDGTADWAISGNNFSALTEGVVECNSGSAGANECDYNFTTSTIKTNVGNLQLAYTAGTSVTDGTNTAASQTLNSGSTPALTDGAAPAPSDAQFYDGSGDGRLDLITVTYSEPLVAIPNGTADWAISSAANFSTLNEGTVLCNSGSAASNECDYNFSTTTTKTDVGDLTLTYTAGTSLQDVYGNISATKILNSASTPLLGDSAAPIINNIATIDFDVDGRLDQILLGFSESIAVASVIAANDLLFDNVGDFTGALFGTDNTDLAGAGTTVTVPLGTEASVIDTFDDSGNLAISTKSSFSIQDAGGNINSTLGSQTLASYSDGMAPVISDFEYQDLDTDGMIDRFMVSFSEAVTATSSLSANDLILSDVGDFTAAAFGANVTDLITGVLSSVTVNLGTESSVADTAEDSGTIAIDSQNAFSLVDVAANTNAILATQAQAGFTDGAAPAVFSADVADVSGDGRLDLVTVTWTETISSVINGAASWAISSAANFAGLSEGVVECNSGSAAADECLYNFTTSTTKTNIGDLTLAYTAGTSITDGANSTASLTLTSASTPPLSDVASPVFVSAEANSDTNVNIVMSEPVDTVTFGAAGAWTATGFTSSAAVLNAGTIDLTVSALGDTAFTASDFAFSTGPGGIIEDVDSNATLSFSGKDIDDGQMPVAVNTSIIADQSACTGTGGVCKIDDIITFSWDNTIDGNTDEATVTADLTAFGGSAVQPLYDNGTNGDTTAGDDIYAYDYAVLADNDDGSNTFTVTVTDGNGNTETTAASVDTAPVDNIAPIIATPGVLAISFDDNTNLTAEIGDEVSYTNAVVSVGDTDTFSIDLSALAGTATATSAGSPYTVLPGILNGNLSFTETARDNAGNETTGFVAAIQVDNASGTGFSAADIAPSSFLISNTAHLTVSFTSTLDLPSDGKIEVIFPSGFNIAGVTAITNPIGLDGTLTPAVVGQTLTVTRSGGTDLTAGTPASFRVDLVGNPPSAGITGTFTLSTKTSTDVTLSHNPGIPGVVIQNPPVPTGGGGGGTGGSYLLSASQKSAEESASSSDQSGGTHQSASEMIFQDITGHWAASYIQKIAELGIVEGKSPDTYAPNDNISRAELIKIAINAFGHALSEDLDKDPLPDVLLTDWFASYVQTAFDRGIIFGFENGLEPNSAASRGMTVTILVKAAGFTDVEKNFADNYGSHEGWTYAQFPDVPMADYFAPYVAYLYDNDVIDGYTDGTFGAANPITRAEIAKIVVNLLDLIEARSLQDEMMEEQGPEEEISEE